MSDGTVPFSEWFDALLDMRTRQKIDARLARVRLGNLGDCNSVGNGVSELRIDYGPGFRVYFGQDGLEVVILLCGGDKSTQKRDIRKAQEYWADYKTKKTMKTASYKIELLTRLADASYAAGYLTDCLEQGEAEFLLGLRDVVEARGGIGQLSKTVDLNRESLYRLLSKDGNPTLSSLSSILNILGIQLQFAPTQKAA
ncbi:MAG: addiction module protein [Verrucomicrobiales bacterium]|nr:addiction module protein [Verrucomicrobiales bacterium]